MPERPYLYYDLAVSICSRCLRKAEGKILFRDGKVQLTKRCPVHGPETVLIADDVDYYRRCREVFLKAPATPLRFNTPVRWGCPYDCGLCPDHEQHSCLALVEVTDRCNLRCPVCYASSGPERAETRDLATLERMLDAVVANEGEPDIVQLSGGEPTLHPDFFAILDAAKRRPIKHLMVNTNGLRIAEDPEFARRLADYMPGFEVYLQFDSLRPQALKRLRGADLCASRLRALDRLDRLGISTTLVATVARGVNDDELGALLDFALTRPSVRGVTLQPVQAAGRLEGFDPARDRLTLTEVRRRVLEQSSVFSAADILPVPCHPDCIAMAYALKSGGRTVPVSGLFDAQALLASGRNTIVYEKDSAVRGKLLAALGANHSPGSAAASLRDLLCCLPQVEAPQSLGYRDVFRLIIMQFLDAYSFDVRSVKKTCVHIATPDGQFIPFDTYNLFYRGELERARLDALRRETEGGRALPAAALPS